MSQQQSLSLSDAEQETIRLANEFSALRRNPAWLKIREYLDGFVAEAGKQRDEARYADDKVLANFQRVYQSRRDAVDCIDDYISSVAEAKRVTLHGIATSLGYSQA